MKGKTMNVIVNGEHHTFDFIEAETVGAALDKLDFDPPFAVAINGEFVSRSSYPSFLLCEGDCVDVVSPVFGG